ncbi:hypothetical protein [Nonomuraea longicatena]|uniref:Lipoprotein n=1 Tax=Nonomuraea longicatena TaxID=83682 RepID=A0ABN1Q446_9ACTN
MNTIGKTALALAAAAVLGGCGGAADPAGKNTAPISKSDGAARETKYRFESVKADCMKGKGFKYIAYVPPEDPDTADERKRAVGDYEALKAQRAKYGFGVFARFVHPKGPDSPESMPDLSGSDPNGDISTKLSPAQRSSYWEAVDACAVVAAQKALGKKVTSARNLHEQAEAVWDKAAKREINGDAELVELASSMVTCLKGKGYKVSGTKPTDLPGRGLWAFFDREDEVGREQRGDTQDLGATLTPAQAKPYLAEEIKAALDDLECGKDFYPAYTPKAAAFGQKVDAEFGS